MKKTPVRCFLFACFPLLMGVPSPAHRVNVFVYPEGREIHVESYFTRGAPCEGCRVEILDGEGNLVATGKTDEEGGWKFSPGGKRDLRLILTAGEGHRTEYELTDEDYPEPPLSLPVEPPQEKNVEPEKPSSRPPLSPPERGSARTVLSATELEKVIDRVLEKKLAPIRRSLARAEVHEPGVTEIIGGIGYIVGIFGIATYFMAREKRREDS